MKIINRKHKIKSRTHKTLNNNSKQDLTIKTMTDFIDTNAHIEEKSKSLSPMELKEVEWQPAL